MLIENLRSIDPAERRRSVAQKPIETVPKPENRPQDWIKYQDLVVFILFDAFKPRVRVGHICSWPGSHGAGHEVDNIRCTVVWSDEMLNPDADDADDAHEKSFDPKDPCLLRLDEADYLKDPERALEWFACTPYATSAWAIPDLFSSPDFGRADEQAESVRAHKAAEESAKARLGYHDAQNVWHPPTVQKPWRPMGP